MNAHRIAALLRELADELDSAPVPSPPANDERPRRRRQRPIVAPPQDVSDVDVQRAVDAARRRGIMVGR